MSSSRTVKFLDFPRYVKLNYNGKLEELIGQISMCIRV